MFVLLNPIFARRHSIPPTSNRWLQRVGEIEFYWTHYISGFVYHSFRSQTVLIGVTIKENDHLVLRPARGVLKVHTKMDTRLLTIRLVPGFDDQILQHLIKAGAESGSLRALVLQLYGTGNAPAAKRQFIDILKEATGLGIMGKR